MLFDVYLFSGDPVDALSSGAKMGELVVERASHDHGLIAHLYRPGTTDDMLRPLWHARLVAMSNKGMALEGYTYRAERDSAKPKTVKLPIRWVVKHVGAPAILNTQKLKERSARRLASGTASGFDPADDDRTD